MIELDKGLDVPIYSPVCSMCEHAHRLAPHHGKIGGGSPGTCKVYPRGIPMEIWIGDHDHLTPYPGDNGVVFKRLLKPHG